MAFDEVQFPTTISAGASGGPVFKTDVIVVNDGYERRNQNWSQGRISYDASYGIRSMADIATVLKFFRARQGMVRGFRFRDPLDYTSASDGISAFSALDQLLGLGNGSATQFQLVKNYTSNGITQQRIIKKPVNGQLLIAVDGVTKALTTDYTVDNTTGIITFVTAPGNALEVRAGFEFDVPARFDADDLDVKLAHYASGQFSIPITEVLL